MTNNSFGEKEAQLFWGMLHKMVNPPPSEHMMDKACVKFIQEKLTEHKEVPTSVIVWNTYKELIDYAVHAAWLPDTLISLIDIERTFVPPEGGFAHIDGSIQLAPWRQEKTK